MAISSFNIFVYPTAIPFLDRQFKNFLVESQEFVRNLQTSTRMMQTVCHHAKRSRDASLALHVPAMKKTHEQYSTELKPCWLPNNALALSI